MTYPFVSVNCWFADGRHIGEIELDLANNNYTRWQFKARPGCWPTKFQNSDVVFKSVWIPIFVHFDGSNVECFIVCLSNLTNQNGNILKKRDTFVQENIWSMTKGRQNLIFFLLRDADRMEIRKYDQLTDRLAGVGARDASARPQRLVVFSSRVVNSKVE